jgi:hypothetical protein
LLSAMLSSTIRPQLLVMFSSGRAAGAGGGAEQQAVAAVARQFRPLQSEQQRECQRALFGVQECTICFDSFSSPRDGAALATCPDHWSCFSCWQGYIMHCALTHCTLLLHRYLMHYTLIHCTLLLHRYLMHHTLIHCTLLLHRYLMHHTLIHCTLLHYTGTSRASSEMDTAWYLAPRMTVTTTATMLLCASSH